MILNKRLIFVIPDPDRESRAFGTEKLRITYEYYNLGHILSIKSGFDKVIKTWELQMQPVVYILASKKNGSLYIGVTSDIVKRIYEHKNSLAEGFSKRYHIYKLVYYEVYDGIEEAIKREKQLKKWNRQ